MNDGAKSTGAAALVTGGIASAFGLAACCAIPYFLAAVGLGSAWLAPIVSASQPHAQLLTALSLAALIGSLALVWWPSRGTPSRARWMVTAAAVVGFVLLVLSKIYA